MAGIPGCLSGLFEGAQVYAGSNVGTGNGCTFAPSRARLPLTLWGASEFLEGTQRLIAAAHSLGIEAFDAEKS